MVTRINKETGEEVVCSDVDFDKESKILLVAWESSKITLDAAKEREMNLRNAYVDFASDPNKTSGTQTIVLGGGFKSKIVKTKSFTFVKDVNNNIDKKRIDQALCKIEADGDSGTLIAERLINWTPSLSKTEYNLLSLEHMDIINDVLILKSGAPTLSIVAPKVK